MTIADGGLQAERTGLAWRRTSLGVAVGSLVCLRLLAPLLGAVGVVLGLLGLCWSVDLAVIASRRLRDAGRAGAAVSPPPRRDGAVIARTAGVAAAVGIAAAVTTLVLATRPG